MFFIPVSAATITDKDVAQALTRLDSELRHRQSYISKRKLQADSLRKLLAVDQRTETRLDVIRQLGDAYNSLNIDSALWFYNHGLREAEAARSDSMTALFALKAATYFPLLGFFNASQEILDSVKAAGIPRGMEAEYQDARRQAAFYVSTFFNDYPEVSQDYLARSQQAQSKLLDLLQPDSPRHRLNHGEVLFYTRRYRKAQECLEILISEIPDSHPLYARACHILADIAKTEGDYRKYSYYLAKSATADVRCATLEVASLQELGNHLFVNGEVERAHYYMSIALENAVECHVPLRMIEASRMLPFVQNAHALSEKRSKTLLWLALALAIAAAVIAAFAIVRVRNKQKELMKLALTLEDAGQLKDNYISQFLKLCSIYMEKLTSFNRMVYMKLTAGKADDLMKLTKTGKMVEELSAEFYDVFDDALLKLYPDFVSEVNKLLQENEQIVLKEGERMNVELRILALMRLGITDATHIARMLNYSVNTIYTYRNKLKNKAIDRDHFEQQVMAIK